MSYRLDVWPLWRGQRQVCCALKFTSGMDRNGLMMYFSVPPHDSSSCHSCRSPRFNIEYHHPYQFPPWPHFVPIGSTYRALSQPRKQRPQSLDGRRVSLERSQFSGLPSAFSFKLRLCLFAKGRQESAQCLTEPYCVNVKVSPVNMGLHSPERS